MIQTGLGKSSLHFEREGTDYSEMQNVFSSYRYFPVFVPWAMLLLISLISAQGHLATIFFFEFGVIYLVFYSVGPLEPPSGKQQADLP